MRASAALAQLAEQRFCKPQVPGPIPGGGSGPEDTVQSASRALVRQEEIERRFDCVEHLGRQVVGQVVVDDVLLPAALHG